MINRREFLRGGFFRRSDGAPDDGPSPPVVRHPRAARDGDGARAFGPIPLLRPPGAIREDLFLERCTKCLDCAVVCPYGAIRPAPARYRSAAGTPWIDPSEQPCWSCPDAPCVRACTPGALDVFPPSPMGTALIQEQTCLAYQGGFCTVCSERCPVDGAIELAQGRPKVQERLCTGCGVCHFVCPAPENAIAILPTLVRAASARAKLDPRPTQFPNECHAGRRQDP
ncbi:MAG: 4Fe-4S dicluster domain-containing protein [Candidatus Eisenbacteria bacterium]